MGEIVCFLLTNKRNVRFFPLSSCWPILFYLILRVKRNMSISVGVVGNTTMNSPFFSIFPADVLLTVALIQQRNIIVLAAVRRRVAIDFRPLSAICATNEPMGEWKLPRIFLGTPRNLRGKIESQKEKIFGREKASDKKLLTWKRELHLKAHSRRKSPFSF